MIRHLHLTPDQLLPGDEVACPDFIRVLTKPEEKGKYVAVGMVGLDTEVVCYFEATRKLVVNRPEQPDVDFGIEAVRRNEREWLNKIKYRKG